ncbi:DUF6537 domain-containing protein [Rhodococcus sp. NCIMB 12038]|uniref:DUF6537 domain-containing protein n=1 Tax=Rhodococcus sp. NCIMB 12038 TaxID=933800 RepID=UPI0015C58C29
MEKGLKSLRGVDVTPGDRPARLTSTTPRSAPVPLRSCVDGNLTYKLHPPTLEAVGRKKKIGLGPRSHTALRVLAKGKRLRGTRWDPFGYAGMRRLERRLAAHYEQMVLRLARDLDESTYDTAVAAAAAADMVRGYEDVKVRNVDNYVTRLRGLGIETVELLDT